MNVELLNKVKAAILKDPRIIRMTVPMRTTPEYTAISAIPECGTVGCIAGWALILAQAAKTDKTYSEIARSLNGLWHNISYDARMLLGLDEMQGIHLFYLENWPDEFQTSYIDGENVEQKAQATVARIDHFITFGK